MFMLNGKSLAVGRAFTHNDIQYPANWLQLASEEDKAAIGVTWEADPVRADDRFYWDGDVNNPKMLEDRLEVKEDGSPLWVQVLDNSDPANPVMVDTDVQVVTRGLKYTWTAQVKNTAGSLLAQSDWYVTRKAERDVAIPEKIVTRRAEIRAECDRLETAIAGCSDIAAFITVVSSQDWGKDE